MSLPAAKESAQHARWLRSNNRVAAALPPPPHRVILIPNDTMMPANIKKYLPRVLHLAGLLSLAYLVLSGLILAGSGEKPPTIIEVKVFVTPSEPPAASPLVVYVEASRLPAPAPVIVESSPRIVEKIVEKTVVVESSPRVVMVESSPRVVVVESSPRVIAAEPSIRVVFVESTPRPLASPLPALQVGAVPAMSLERQSARLYTMEGHSHLAANDLPEDGLAPLTRWVQDFLWRHQHRSGDECAKAKYLRSNHYHSGLGSQLHVAGHQMAYAIAEGRVWYWSDTAGDAYTQPAHCGTVKSWLCYFQPPTNCTPPQNADTAFGVDPADFRSDKNFVPPVIKDRLMQAAPHMRFDEVKYWWRAQSVAYIMRMNQRTVEAIAAIRRAERMVQIKPESAPAAPLLRSLPQPLFPLPPGTVSIHVRHGDKGKEMELQPFSRYFNAAEALMKTQPFLVRRAVFVSSEDPGVIKEATENKEGWAALYSDIPRHDSNGWDQMHLADNMVLLHFTQMLMALECDAWVGTRGSNWNRMLDELRCVWVAKCTHPYVEVGAEKNAKEYDWR